MIRYLVLVFLISSSSVYNPSSSLNRQVNNLVASHSSPDIFKKIVDFEDWWYLNPESYRHNLNKYDAKLIAKLLSTHETTFYGAAILVKTPNSLHYIEPQIFSALKRERRIRAKTYGKFLISKSTGYQEYDSLLCLKSLLRNKNSRNSVCAFVMRQEHDVMSR